MGENPKCPKCGGEDTVPICYGMPMYETYQKEQKGELVLGGVVLAMIRLLGTTRTAKTVGAKFLNIRIGKDKSYLKGLKDIGKSRD